MADEMVLETQKWLNKTYGNVSGFGSVPENGKTGWDTIYGLIRATQVELGILDWLTIGGQQVPHIGTPNSKIR